MVIILNKKLMILGLLIFLVFISVSAVSATDNMTDVIGDDQEYNAEITINDFSSYYFSDDDLNFDFKSSVSVSEDTRFDVVDSKTGKKIGAAYYIDGEGHGQIYADVGTYKAELKQWDFIDSPYKVKPVLFNVKVSKAPVKLSAQKWISTTKQSATLKVTVKDENNWDVEEGTVKFTINGKSYNVKVKNGVATKNVKLTKAKTYTYKAVFSSKNYKTKSVSSKVYVKKYKKYYTFKVNKYSGKISYSKYVQLIKAKNNHKYKCVHLVLGKLKGKYPIHMYIDTLQRDMLYPKGDYVHVWIDNGMGMDGPTYYKKINLCTLNP